MTREIWKRTNKKQCPYCGALIVRSKTGMYLYDCTVCERGWNIDSDGTWHSLFDAANATFDKDGRRIDKNGIKM